ncbi:MAG: glycosyl transferase [Paenibacillaceae bacterium]|jgi:glycosyltransferase involved in cell wall biosynthesis|nr:glycosyl transferase [Paenibacillaceae bacterium]
MRVAYLDHTAKWSGGEVALFNLLTHMGKEIEPLVILAEDGPLANRLREKGIDVRIIPLDEDVRNRNRNAVSLGAIGAAYRLMRYGQSLIPLLKAEGVSCVHTNSLKSAFYGAIAAKAAGIPLIWHIRDHIGAPYLKPIVAKGIRLLSRFIPNGVIANSKSTLQVLGLPEKKKTLVLYSAFARTGEREDAAPKRDAFIVLLVGRLAPWKGQHVLLEAAKSFREEPNVEFWLAGDALFGEETYRSELLLKMEKDGLSNVRLLGHVDGVQSLMQQAHLLVHTSITPEPFGQVIVEGMAAGLPVIASNEGGPVEIVVDGETGLLIEPGQPDVLAQAIRWMMDHPTERDRMGEKAVLRVNEHFVIEGAVKQVASYYQGVIANG